MKYTMQSEEALRQPANLPFLRPFLVVFAIALVPSCIIWCRLLGGDEAIPPWMSYISGSAFGVVVAVAIGVVGVVLHNLIGFVAMGGFHLRHLTLMLAALAGAIAVGLAAITFIPEWIWESNEVRVMIYALMVLEGVHRMVTRRKMAN